MVHPQACTNWGVRNGINRRKPPRKKSKTSPGNSSPCMQNEKPSKDLLSVPTIIYKWSWRLAFFMKIPLIRERRWRIPNAIWNRHSPWIDWFVVMWVSAKQKLPCAQRSKRSAIANKWQCLCPQPFWRNNTIALLPNDSLAFPLPWIISIGLNQPRNKKLHSTKSRTER